MNVLKPIPRNTRYSINKNEQVWDGKRNRWLKTHIGCNGYRAVNLCQNGRSQLVLIHRLLLETFVGPCPEGMQCNHKDGNRQNNDLENLEWVSPRVNVQNQVARNTHSTGGNQSRAYVIKQLLTTKSFTNRTLAKMFHVCEQTISDIRTGKRWVNV